MVHFTPDPLHLLMSFIKLMLVSLPGWLPIAFASYWAGRRKFKLIDLMVLIAWEGPAILVAVWAESHIILYRE